MQATNVFIISHPLLDETIIRAKTSQMSGLARSQSLPRSVLRKIYHTPGCAQSRVIETLEMRLRSVDGILTSLYVMID